MSEIKLQAINDLEDYVLRESNEYNTSRSSDIRRLLESLDTEVIDDSVVIKFLTASKLSQEIREGEA